MSANESQGFENTLKRLHAARTAWTSRSALLALWQACGIATLTLGALIGLEILFRPSVGMRMFLSWYSFVPACIIGITLWLRRATADTNLRNTARRIQNLHPDIGRRLEGALDLHGAQESCPLSQAALSQVSTAAESLNFKLAAKIPDARRKATPAIAIVSIALILLAISPERITNAASRLFFPRAIQKTVGSVRILSVSPGKSETVEGSDLEIKAVVDNPAFVSDAKLQIAKPANKETGKTELTGSRRLSKAEEKTFSYTLRSVRENFRYRVLIGTSTSEWFDVRVHARPAVTAVFGRVTPPAYTGVEMFEIKNRDGSIRAPAGSKVELKIKTNHAIREGRLRLSSGLEIPLITQGDSVTGEFELGKSGTYTISLLDERGNTNSNPMTRPLEATADALPKLRLAKPGANARMGLDTNLPILIEARDDYGLKEVSLFFRRNRRGEPQLLKKWPVGGQNTLSCDLAHDMELSKNSFALGDTITLYAEATDHGPAEPRIGRSTSVTVTIINPKKAAREEANALEKVFRRLGKVLKAQKEIREKTVKLPVTNDKEFLKTATYLAKRQASARAVVLEAAYHLNEAKNKTASRIRLVLNSLAANEMAGSVIGLEHLQTIKDQTERRELIAKIIPPQAETVKRISQILGILPELKEKLLEPEKEETGTDMSQSAVDAMNKLKDALDKFTDDQRKVIDATKELNKEDVDDFTPEEEALLKDLKAKEDSWANMLKDIGSDLSKVPKQDFSNPSLLGEVITVLEEVELAGDAFTQKEVVIATQAATTGMELAESLTTHVEKWLMDHADHRKWDMEEPLGDYEVPMAELPDKLEDIVGELMEQEEDIMQETEDVSSSWADSLDKGAGWDTADGPISNYSAQGVTGNQMPNDTEIGGRSGEGRQGKSHGEMVSDTAVGKGGRRTPSRLTPDSYEEGQINDQSKDSSGGATGGGKGGAAGMEGLEGPPPPQEKGELPRLLGKQAELRNRAERLNLKLKLMGYNTAILEDTLAEMRSVEQDMKSGRYKSAARRRHLLIQGLKSSQDAALGESRARADRAAGLPRELQREIMNSLGGKLPKGYEDLVKAYYEKLAQE